MRLIDADDFMKRMYHEAFETDTDLQRWDSGCWIRYRMVEDIIKSQPPADPELTYHVCADALLKMRIYGVLTDGEYNRIMDKLNARCANGKERL